MTECRVTFTETFSIHTGIHSKSFMHVTIFPHIVSAETILFWIWKLQPIQIPSCQNISIFTAFAEETILGRKLFKGGNFMRKYGILYLSSKQGYSSVPICRKCIVNFNIALGSDAFRAETFFL